MFFDGAAKIAAATREIDPVSPKESLDYSLSNLELERLVKELTWVIATNASNQGREYVIPTEIVAWAIENETLSTKSEVAITFERHRVTKQTAAAKADSILEAIASHKKDTCEFDRMTNERNQALEEIVRLKTERATLLKKVKNTGKHHLEKKVEILAAALHRLANYWADCVDSKSKVVAAKLAEQVQDNRVHYGFEIEDRDPAASVITEHITQALSEKKWRK